MLRASRGLCSKDRRFGNPVRELNCSYEKKNNKINTKNMYTYE